MSKLFLSADIEGTCGVAHWDETDPDKQDYAAFADQMSREVGAACEGLLMGGADSILVRDAHNTARNIRTSMLPDNDRISILRGWARDPYAMMSGLDESFTGVLFTGYHSAAGWDGNPLSHTMNTQNQHIRINGEDCSELMINSMTASMLGVPVLMVAGDRQLCDWFHTKVPSAVTVPVSCGLGDASMSIMPGEAVRRIRTGAERAMALSPQDCLFPMPEHFRVEIEYRRHFMARAKSWYPGASQKDATTVLYESDRWFDVLTFFHFCL